MPWLKLLNYILFILNNLNSNVDATSCGVTGIVHFLKQHRKFSDNLDFTIKNEMDITNHKGQIRSANIRFFKKSQLSWIIF